MVFLAPTVYGEPWRPLWRLAVLWVMAIIIIILVRAPLPELPNMLGPLGR